jgi:2-polyprenyl-3-methyl-5-hydroxy-6-metoxy-1,4-benzoquinol methylase
MHYVINDCLVKSENAALSSRQASAQVIQYIENLSAGINILDYGCGKCRYSRQLNNKSKSLVLIDSEIQINRKQIICGVLTTVKDYANTYLVNTNVCSLENSQELNLKFDFILCTNVLSAIPSTEDRIFMLNNVKRFLDRDGKALITVQYYNSYFNTYSKNPKAAEYNDGWIIPKGNDFTYYGIIKPQILIGYCESAGLNIKHKYLKDGSIYLTVQNH